MEYLVGILAIASISHTIAYTGIFLEVRELISKIHPKLEDLIHCPWCMSFWLLLTLNITWSVDPLCLFEVYWIDLLVMVFAMWSPVGLIHFVLLRAYNPITTYLAQRKINKIKKGE